MPLRPLFMVFSYRFILIVPFTYTSGLELERKIINIQMPEKFKILKSTVDFKSFKTMLEKTT